MCLQMGVIPAAIFFSYGLNIDLRFVKNFDLIEKFIGYFSESATQNKPNPSFP